MINAGWVRLWALSVPAAMAERVDRFDASESISEPRLRRCSGARLPVMELREIAKGANLELPLDTGRLQLVVGWRDGTGDRGMDAAALLLAGRKVRSDTDFVFYNQPSSEDGSVCLLGSSVTESGVEERISVDFESVPEDVDTIVIAASIDRGCFGDLDGLHLLALDGAGTPVARYDVTDADLETAFVFGEVYRRGVGWKLRAVGQGWDSGLAGLATDFGVTVDESETGGNNEPETGDDAEFTVVPLAETSAAPTAAPAAAPSPARAPGKGVRTRKSGPARSLVPVPTLAMDESWQAARLFSIAGIRAADEQEKRATASLLATMLAVRPFARGIVGRLGGPGGVVETYAEVQFALEERVVIPDGVIRVARAGRIWTCLLEVKTGTGQLRRDQVEKYLDVAREQGFDAVVTLSNEIAPGAGEHPIAVDKRKLRRVGLFHLSWAEVLREARMVLTHRGVDTPLQAWVLSEFIRYLEHPRSGASGFDDMGPAWVAVRESVAAGTLRASDRKAPAVADAWLRLIRFLCLRLTAELGVNVGHALPRKLAGDPSARQAAVVTKLAMDGVLDATLRIPGAVGPINVAVDLRVGHVRAGVRVAAPRDGTAQRRVSWLLRQLGEAVPDDLVVEVGFAGRNETTCERLADVRAKPAILIVDRGLDIATFRLSRSSPMGTKRSGVRGAFVPTVVAAVETFYGDVVQGLKAWPSPVPHLPDDTLSEATAVSDAAA